MPVPRKTPAGIHMPGPSFAPVFAAIGAALLFFGMVYGGPILILGLLALALTLLYWLAEGDPHLRPRGRDDGARAAGRGPRRAAARRPHAGAVVPPDPRRDRHRDPLPRTRLRRLDAHRGRPRHGRHARRLAVRRRQGVPPDARRGPDRPPRQRPAPRTPVAMFSLLAVVLVGGILLQTGLLPPARGERLRRGRRGIAGPVRIGRHRRPPVRPRPAARPSRATSTSPRSGSPSSRRRSPRRPTRPFTIAFDNEDAGVTHNIEIHDADGRRRSGRARSSRASRHGSTTSPRWPPASTSSSAPSIRP